MKAYLKDGIVVALHNNDRHAPTEEEGFTVVDLEGRRDLPDLGWSLIDGKFVDRRSKTEPIDLEKLREAALKTLAYESEAVRSSFLETGTQLGVYTAKFQDAKAFKMQVFGTDLANYPWIRAEVSATGCTASAAADRFIAKYNAMVDAFTKTEEVRIFAKSEIRKAKTVDSIREARNAALKEFKLLHQA